MSAAILVLLKEKWGPQMSFDYKMGQCHTQGSEMGLSSTPVKLPSAQAATNCLKFEKKLSRIWENIFPAIVS